MTIDAVKTVFGDLSTNQIFVVDDLFELLGAACANDDGNLGDLPSLTEAPLPLEMCLGAISTARERDIYDKWNNQQQ